MATYQWLAQYVKKYSKLPPANEMFAHIVHDHLREDPNYYAKLATIEAD